MRKMTNFSNTEQETLNLAIDLARDEFSQYIDETKVTKKSLENHLRDKINNEILQGRTLYQALRKNNIAIFEIQEEIINTAIGEDMFTSPFVEEFVEFKNRGLGDTSKFYAEGGLLSVATFAGNHWDTNREALELGDEVTLPKEWCYIHCYTDLDRFLLGIDSLEKINTKIFKSVQKFFKDRLAAQFANVAKVVPDEFSGRGNTEEALGKIVDIVSAAGGYENITIAGTKGALRKLANVVPDKMFANSQKEAKAMTGSIGEWENNKLLVIPQTLKSGTFELGLSDDTVFILGGDTKPIKFEFYGDTRTKMDTEGKFNNDQSVDIQAQTLFGMGLVLPQYFGTFQFT